MLKAIEGGAGKEEERVGPDELTREGARRMWVTPLKVEVPACAIAHNHVVGKEGCRLVVRNGKARSRQVTLGTGTIAVRAPRINDKRVDEDGHRQRFTTGILSPHLRKSRKVAEYFPVLNLRGLSTGDFRSALTALLGDAAAGLSATSIARLTAVWEKEYRAFDRRRLEGRDCAYVWANGIHFNVRLEKDRLCTLVIIGALPDGKKELVALADGYRESTESWQSVLRDLQRRGLRALVVAVGDGTLGFWAALRDIYPETQAQRGWCHKLLDILEKLPKRLQPQTSRMLPEVMYAPTRKYTEQSMETFVVEFSDKRTKVTDCLLKDRDALLTLFGLPAKHWVYLRTTNPIESPFATVRLRQRVTKGAGSRAKALTVAFKVLEMSEQRWCRIIAAHLMPLVRAAVTFVNGQKLKDDSVWREAA